MSEHNRNHEELSDEQLSNVAGGAGNSLGETSLQDQREDILDSRSKSDSPVADIQETRLGELDKPNK